MTKKLGRPKGVKNKIWDESESEIPIPGYPPYFMTESLKVISRHNNEKPIVMTAYLGALGYYAVNLSVDGKLRQPRLHRLVWITFRGPIPDGMQINHLDGDKLNNQLSNIEVVTPQENVDHAIRTGLWKPGPKS